MSCICSQNLSKLSAAVPATPPSVDTPAPLEKLGGMIDGAGAAGGDAAAGGAAAAGGSAGGALSAKTSMSASSKTDLSASAMSDISTMAQANAAAKAGFGYDLTSPGASDRLSATFKAANANLGAMKPLLALDPAPWLALAALATLVGKIKLAFGVNVIGSASAATALTAAMSAVAGGSSSVKVAGSSKAAMAASGSGTLGMSAKAMGVGDLSEEGAMDSFAAKLQAVSGLTIPALAVPVSALMSPIAIFGAMAAIVTNLGVNPLSPEFPTEVQSLSGKLGAFDSMKIDSNLGAAMNGSAAGAATAGATSSTKGTAAAKVGGSAAGKIDASALGKIKAPDLGGVTALAGFSNGSAAAGFPVAESSACGPSCPM